MPTWLRLRVLNRENSLDFPGGPKLITGSLRSRELSLAGVSTAAEEESWRDEAEVVGREIGGLRRARPSTLL